MSFEFDALTTARLKKLVPLQDVSMFGFIHNAVHEALSDIESVIRAEAILEKIESGEMETYSLQEVREKLEEWDG